MSGQFQIISTRPASQQHYCLANPYHLSQNTFLSQQFLLLNRAGISFGGREWGEWGFYSLVLFALPTYRIADEITPQFPQNMCCGNYYSDKLHNASETSFQSKQAASITWWYFPYPKLHHSRATQHAAFPGTEFLVTKISQTTNR